MTEKHSTAPTRQVPFFLRGKAAPTVGRLVLLLLLAPGILLFAMAARGTAPQPEQGTMSGSPTTASPVVGAATTAPSPADIPAPAPSPLGASGPNAESTDSSPAASAAEDSRPVVTRDVDLVIYGTTTSGIGALRGLQIADLTHPSRLRIAVVAGGPHIESPLAQGLGVEDVYGPDSVSGFYAEFRRGVIREYAARGIYPLNREGRLLYEPEVAEKILRFFLNRNGMGRPNVTLVHGRLREAADQDERYVLVDCGERLVRITTRFLVDASPEADLAPMLAASYTIGRSEDVYNDVAGNPAPRPSSANGWVTAPQALSVLLTLKEYRGSAPRLASIQHPGYHPSSFDPLYAMSEQVRSGFVNSWSLSYRLPNGKFELNEAWGDYTNAHASYDWTMYPEKRAAIRSTIQTYVLNKFRYLQENGYGRLGVAHIPTRPYVREGVRILGMSVYTETQMLDGYSGRSVAFGRYARYDRHDAVVGSEQDGRPQTVHVPMESLMPKGHPWLLVTTAISTDYRTYSSAVRMESVRANVGGAAGIIVALANAQGLTPHQVQYDDVRRQLLRQGHRLQ